MPIFIQNSLTKKKEEFVPIEAGKVNMYTCGVTVYDDCHVGHARSLFIFDYIKRYLEYKGYRVKLVRNITDVDDKIINRAKEEGVEFGKIRDTYIKHYERDLKEMEIEKADFEPTATENIFYMTDHIKKLISKGSAYEVDGDVYFSVRSFPQYGRLSGQSPDEMLTAVRIEKDEKKRDSLDFALWKKSKEGEPSWESPWGLGRPGWHIECSTMSMRYLKTETLDIHAGGRDLIFPHHENEIAQAEALTNKTFAKYWIHHGLLTIDGRKMSKSLGNFVTIQDVLKKHSADVLKLLFLSAHYSSEMDFSFNSLQESDKVSKKFGEFLGKVESKKGQVRSPKGCDSGLSEEIKQRSRTFEDAMDDDFNTAQALAVLFDLVNFGNKSLDSGGIAQAVEAAGLLKKLGSVLGLSLPKRMEISLRGTVIVKERIGACLDKKELDDEEKERLIQERQEARKRRDFKRADEIRELLKKYNVIIDDTKKLQ